MHVIRMSLPLPPNVANLRGHWRVRRRTLRAWRDRALGRMVQQGYYYPSEPWARARIRCAFWLASGTRMDRDNLAARQKPILDFLKQEKGGAGFFVDDSPDILEVLEPTQAFDHTDPRVEITLERLA